MWIYPRGEITSSSSNPINSLVVCDYPTTMIGAKTLWGKSPLSKSGLLELKRVSRHRKEVRKHTHQGLRVEDWLGAPFLSSPYRANPQRT